MDWSNVVIYAVVALVLMFLLPKLGIRGRGGNSPLNPPGRNPGGGGGGLFPGGGGGVRGEPKAPTNSPDTEGDFADRIEGDGRREKST